MNIKRRGIDCDPLCPCCSRVNEDGAHLLLKCKGVKHLWKRFGLEEECLRMSTYDNAHDVVQDILELGDRKAGTACCLIWRWWLRRNKLNKGEKACTEEEVEGQVKYWSRECESYCSSKSKVPGQKTVEMWSPLVGDSLKINLDGSFLQGSGKGGWGFVIRDGTGQARGAGAGRLEHLASALHAEAFACLAGVCAAAGWGMGCVQIESDSQTLIKALKGPEFNLMAEGVLFKEIRSFVSLNFLPVSFSYCPRLCNKVAHALAALGANQPELHLHWQEAVLESVTVLVASEFAELT
jgi:hypothetical protein